MNPQLGLILRWVALLPGIILAMLLSGFPAHWVALMLTANNPDAMLTFDNKSPMAHIPFPAMLDITRAFFAPLAGMMGAVWIAPKGKYVTAGVVGGVVIVGRLIVTALVWEKMVVWSAIAGLVANLVACVVAATWIAKQYPRT